MRQFGVRSFLVWLAIFTIGSGPRSRANEAPARPDLAIFLADDLGWWDTTVNGATDVRTPNMQRLASEGLTFTHAFVASPSCAPSRGAFLTGLMPARNGAEANHRFVRDGIKALPSYLHDLGYEVVAFGKVAHSTKDAKRLGFDHVDGRNEASLVAQYLDSRDRSRPLALFVGTHNPHVPWPDNDGYDPAEVTLPPKHIDTPETREFRARYYTEVTRADTELGQIHDLVREHLGRDTLFLFSSDHGAQWPFGKWNLYDAGIRVPLIVAWPGVVPPGTTTDAMVSWIDILPTLIDVAGGKPPVEIDGRSFAPVLRGETDEHRDRIFTTHSGDREMNIYPIRSVRTARWKYIRNLHPKFAYTTHIDQAEGRDGLKYWLPWLDRASTDPTAARKVSRYYRRPAEELYDLKADPHERHDLAALPQHAETLAKLRAEVQAWMEEQGDQETVFDKPRLLSNPEDWDPAPMEEEEVSE